MESHQPVLPVALRQLKKFFTDSAILAFPVLQTGQVELSARSLRGQERIFSRFAGPTRCGMPPVRQSSNQVNP